MSPTPAIIECSAGRTPSRFSNGDKADLVIGQVGLVLDYGRPGPGTNFTAGFNSPTGLLVDVNGNLLVADENNNRILRFPKPFAQQGGQFPDLYIGQPNLNSKVANYSGSATVPTALGLNLAGSPAPTVTMAFDADKNLWVTDGGNRRVLRYAAKDVAAGGGSLRANLVLGQLDFDSRPAGRDERDPHQRQRVFVIRKALPSIPPAACTSPIRRPTGASAACSSSPRPSAITRPPPALWVSPRPRRIPTQDAADKTAMSGPTGIFFIPSAGKMGVVDAFSSRILLFDTYDNGPTSQRRSRPKPPPSSGSRTSTTGREWERQLSYLQAPTASTFSGPQAVAFSGTELFVADTGNNRVLVMPFTGGHVRPATRVLGQDNFTMSGINLVEGREFAFLARKRGRRRSGARRDCRHAAPLRRGHLQSPHPRLQGFPEGAGRIQSRHCARPARLSVPTYAMSRGNPDAPTASSLCFPTGLTVDPQGNLYVADLGNGRVSGSRRRSRGQGPLPQADLVLGQRNFTTKITDPSASTMSQPYGVALSATNGLFVSDVQYNRVLYFPFTSNNTFTAGTDNGRAATKVFGQPDFTTVTTGNSDTAMNAAAPPLRPITKPGSMSPTRATTAS